MRSFGTELSWDDVKQHRLYTANLADPMAHNATQTPLLFAILPAMIAFRRLAPRVWFLQGSESTYLRQTRHKITSLNQITPVQRVYIRILPECAELAHDKPNRKRDMHVFNIAHPRIVENWVVVPQNGTGE